MAIRYQSHVWNSYSFRTSSLSSMRKDIEKEMKLVSKEKEQDVNILDYQFTTVYDNDDDEVYHYVMVNFELVEKQEKVEI